MTSAGPGPVRWIAGAMTGTSLDGLDVALARVTGRGLGMTAALVAHASQPLGPLRDDLLILARGDAQPPRAYLRAARRLGELHADAIDALCRASLPHDATLDFVAAHGQTICHLPGEGLSWQLLDPWPVVRRLGVAVVHDLRQADLIAGGQGAPITPIADPILYGGDTGLVFNLGGIVNYTAWGGRAGRIEGGDITTCNLLLDGLIQRLKPGTRFDRDGELAMAGEADDALVALIAAAIPTAPGPDTSLGREQLTAATLDALVERILAAVPDATAERVLASAVEAIADRTHAYVEAHAPARVIVAGGGARNAALVAAMKRRDTDANRWLLSDELGIACEAREAMAFAVLGALCDDGVPITLPHITGSAEVGVAGVAGVWAGR